MHLDLSWAFTYTNGPHHLAAVLRTSSCNTPETLITMAGRSPSASQTHYAILPEVKATAFMHLDLSWAYTYTPSMQAPHESDAAALSHASLDALKTANASAPSP